VDVAQVTHKYRPSIGGIENYVYRLNESARANDHTVTTYTTDRSLQNEASPLTAESNVHYCETTASILRNPLSIELHGKLRSSDHDLYHLHSPWFLPTLEAAHAIPNDAPAVMTVHGADIRATGPLVQGLNLAYRPLAGYVFDHVDHTIALGTTERRYLLDRFDLQPSTVSVVPNGIYPEEFDVSDSELAQFRQRHGLDPDVPTILYVSRLTPEKNPDILLDAVVDHLPSRELQVLVVGTGEQSVLDDLRARADDRVRFLSNLSFEALKAAYHTATVFVFLGTWEGLPTVVLEAMAAGAPVVTTDVGAIPDVVEDGTNGRLLPESPDPQRVADAIEHYLDRPAERAAVSRRNRERIEQRYHWDDVACSILDIYKKVADE
jgi:glycosyltransferase involved in cell wall biosynthesis